MTRQQYNPSWVGHRGWPQVYPENSLVGVRAALERGAHAVEIDVQFTADGEPVLLHDVNLQRVADQQLNVLSNNFSALASTSVHEPSRFGSTYYPTVIAHLDQFVELISQYPERKAFIEIKADALDVYSRASILNRLEKILAPIFTQVYLISFDLYLLRLAQERGHYSVGWVLTHFDAMARARIRTNPVDIVICDICKIPENLGELWSGPWQWFVYDVVTTKDYERSKALRIEWLETWDIGSMLNCESHATI